MEGSGGSEAIHLIADAGGTNKLLMAGADHADDDLVVKWFEVGMTNSGSFQLGAGADVTEVPVWNTSSPVLSVHRCHKELRDRVPAGMDFRAKWPGTCDGIVVIERVKPRKGS